MKLNSLSIASRIRKTQLSLCKPILKRPVQSTASLHKRDAMILRKLKASSDQPEDTFRWLKEASRSRSQLARMVHEHVVNAKPLSYCIGHQPFNDLALLIRPHVLIPRPETEAWVADLSRELAPKLVTRSKPFTILEIGSGSGCIALHLAASLPEDSAIIHSFDYSAQAIALCRSNVKRNQHLLRNFISFHQMDLFDSSLPDQLLALTPDSSFDCIVSNPPYIPPDEYAQLDKSVKAWEDEAALVGSQQNVDGLEYYRKIAELCGLLLKGQEGMPKVVLEVGWKQAEAVRDIFAHLGTVKIEKDIFGVDRVVKVH